VLFVTFHCPDHQWIANRAVFVRKIEQEAVGVLGVSRLPLGMRKIVVKIYNQL